MPASKVVVIVLNWNRRDLTLQCLRSLDRLQYENVTILVVDNGSRDGSLEAVEAAYPRVQRLALPENSGFARGNNAGLELALKAGPDWIMFLNNDTEVAPDLADVLAGNLPDGFRALQSKVADAKGRFSWENFVTRLEEVLA